MSHIHKTLRLCNKPSALLESHSNGFFSARVPADFRDKPAHVTVLSGLVTNLDNAYQGGVDPEMAFIRSNLMTNSYDVTTKGNNTFLGSIVRPAGNELSASLDTGNASLLGEVILPPVIEIELMGVVAASGLLARLSAGEAVIEIVLGLEYEK